MSPNIHKRSHSLKYLPSIAVHDQFARTPRKGLYYIRMGGVVRLDSADKTFWLQLVYLENDVLKYIPLKNITKINRSRTLSTTFSSHPFLREETKTVKAMVECYPHIYPINDSPTMFNSYWWEIK
jgi:hypothetical protein